MYLWTPELWSLGNTDWRCKTVASPDARMWAAGIVGNVTCNTHTHTQMITQPLVEHSCTSICTPLTLWSYGRRWVAVVHQIVPIHIGRVLSSLLVLLLSPDVSGGITHRGHHPTCCSICDSCLQKTQPVCQRPANIQCIVLKGVDPRTSLGIEYRKIFTPLTAGTFSPYSRILSLELPSSHNNNNNNNNTVKPAFSRISRNHKLCPLLKGFRLVKVTIRKIKILITYIILIFR